MREWSDPTFTHAPLPAPWPASRPRPAAGSSLPTHARPRAASDAGDPRSPAAALHMMAELPPAPSDAELMARVAAGDELAFGQLYDRHVRVVYGAVLRYLRDPGSAEDVVQEAFLATWSQATSFSADAGSVVGWLLSIARHRAIDRLRAAARRPVSVGLAPSTSTGAPESDADRLVALGRPVAFGAVDGAPHEIAERNWVRSVVRTAVAEMPDVERQALELAYDDGLSQSEIAERLGWPLGTVKTRTRRGLLRLREMLEGVPELAPGSAVARAIADPQDPDGVDDGSR